MGKKRHRKKKQNMSEELPLLSTSVDNTNKIDTQVERQSTPLNILFPMIKACRLCENREGPFLNIFGTTEKVMAKKIDDLLPFVIKEDDELPHKICYRCSAKVEELHDFVQKCIKSQENLEKELGKKDTFVAKTSMKKKWEETLTKTDKTNDDICDAVIQKAIERIRDINTKCVDNIPNNTKEGNKKAKEINKKPAETPKNTGVSEAKILNTSDTGAKKERQPLKNKGTELDTKSITLKSTKAEVLNVNQNSEEVLGRRTRSTRSAPENEILPNSTCATIKELNKEIIEKPKESQKLTEKQLIQAIQEEMAKKSKTEKVKPIVENKPALITTEFKIHSDVSDKNEKPQFNIMDHISTIKVNGVGTLFQCKLCNRNFLNKDAVMSHGCAKFGAPKDVANPMKALGIEPVKIPQVKYITQHSTEKLDKLNTSDANVSVKSKPGPASKTMLQKSNNIVTIDKNNCPVINNDALTIKRFAKETTQSDKNSGSKKRKPEVLVIDDDDGEGTSSNKVSSGPYPVGLFQTIPRSESPKVATPAMKKQSYTVLQTDNPSKLLISTRPRSEMPGPKSKKSKKAQEESNEKPEQPFSVTLEDSNRQTNSNDNFFTFINVDPLLQPSYVLPTNNTIQESRISTSSTGQGAKPKDSNYACTMCTEVFSREKKLLAHMQGHFNAMDRYDDRPKKRTRTT